MILSDRSEVCSQCGGPMMPKPLRPFPVVTQVAFGGSFIAFILLGDKLRLWSGGRGLTFVWAGVQVVIGALLMWQRMQAKRLVLRCIRCGQALPSSVRR